MLFLLCPSMYKLNDFSKNKCSCHRQKQCEKMKLTLSDDELVLNKKRKKQKLRFIQAGGRIPSFDSRFHAYFSQWAVWTLFGRVGTTSEESQMTRSSSWGEIALFYYFPVIAYSVPVCVLCYKLSCCQMQWYDLFDLFILIQKIGAINPGSEK